jgi:hypothetical protein
MVFSSWRLYFFENGCVYARRQINFVANNGTVIYLMRSLPVLIFSRRIHYSGPGFGEEARCSASSSINIDSHLMQPSKYSLDICFCRNAKALRSQEYFVFSDLVKFSYVAVIQLSKIAIFEELGK